MIHFHPEIERAGLPVIIWSENSSAHLWSITGSWSEVQLVSIERNNAGPVLGDVLVRTYAATNRDSTD